MKYPEIDPVAVSIGPFEFAGQSYGPLDIHWYGLMYLLGFAGAWLLALRRAGFPHTVVQRSQVENLTTYVAFGVILGGRFGYVFFYHFNYWLSDPVWLFRVWEGGMSFHGGLLGVIVALALFAWRTKVSFLALTDFVAPLVPIGLGLGRLGNFIGQELWGRAADVPWAMVFPKDPEGIARHPSQLYQATLEGLVLFTVLYWYSSKPRPRGAVAGLFLVLYACFRIFAEFFREPDQHISFDLFGWVTRGQLLSLPMLILGIGVLVWSWQQQARRRQSGR
ncbi:prolipoprotein diacylglyceryl transferase [Marinimicrobium sp. C6131]|uniref:prolipoprotein diacylglyceryl transferase n=1 Tax=Marinimicrobium sp. C6131 TaxID=3022676 RepID=UPI00223DAF94|nr:prolipoprotein diacylglyceryl transferase [Marinimicrobium sp. C6131]UZJ43288.1 prolipoprotein diacylglyceryl transferase [Marinimicrobium sp. C6131]